MQTGNLMMEPTAPRGHGVACDFLHATISATADNTVAMFRSLCRRGVLPMIACPEPHRCEPEPVLCVGSNKPFHSWFDFAAGTLDETLAGALESVMAHIKEYGPYDGVYGFSQGCVIASCLASETVWRGMFGQSQCPVKFVVCAMAGGISALSSCRIPQQPPVPPATLQLPITVRSFHLIGGADSHASDSERLAEMYRSVDKFGLRQICAANSNVDRWSLPLSCLNSGAHVHWSTHGHEVGGGASSPRSNGCRSRSCPALYLVLGLCLCWSLSGEGKVPKHWMQVPMDIRRDKELFSVLEAFLAESLPHRPAAAGANDTPPVAPAVVQVMTFTGAARAQAEQVLRVSGGDVSTAVNMLLG